MSRNAIYVNTSDDFGEESFSLITHFGDEETLEDGVHISYQGNGFGCAVVDSEKCEQFIDMFNHAPGCSVRGWE